VPDDLDVLVPFEAADEFFDCRGWSWSFDG
jgi:hypothetical protein